MNLTVELEAPEPIINISDMLVPQITHVLNTVHPDMQKVAATRPLAAEIFLDCGREKAGMPLNLRKLSEQIL